MCNIPCKLCGDKDQCDIFLDEYSELEEDINYEDLGLADCLPEDF